MVSRVLNSDGDADLVVSVAPTRLAIVRCVDEVMLADHTALATMMTRGECVWAGIVYSEREGSETTGWVETFHVSELDRLVKRLGELQRVFGGDAIGSGEVVA